jgi:hypothetical protein
MDLSKTVAYTTLVLVVVLAAGHALAQETTLSERERQRQEEFARDCTIKAVMTDAEIEKCRIAHRR